MIKRISAVFLITAMIIGLCPQTVYAENETGQAENSQQTAEQGEGYHFVDLELPKTAGTQSKAGVRAYGAGIPEKYDARSLIGTVRKQGGFSIGRSILNYKRLCYQCIRFIRISACILFLSPCDRPAWKYRR